jgi:hypothetical protein
MNQTNIQKQHLPPSSYCTVVWQDGGRRGPWCQTPEHKSFLSCLHLKLRPSSFPSETRRKILGSWPISPSFQDWPLSSCFFTELRRTEKPGKHLYTFDRNKTQTYHVHFPQTLLPDAHFLFRNVREPFVGYPVQHNWEKTGYPLTRL